MPSHLDAVIFDFDGVIANSEPLHYQAFADTLDGAGFSLTREDYYARYLGYDDVGAFDAVARDQGRPFDETAIAALVAVTNHVGVVINRVNLAKHARYGYGDHGDYYSRYRGYYGAGADTPGPQPRPNLKLAKR